MFGRTNAGGGVSAKGFIQTTYPEGGICTCSDGSRTLKAKDTSGFMMFMVPYIGTWTVTATDPADPTKTASETVEITKEGKSVSVELNFGLILYENGVEHVTCKAYAYAPSTSSSGGKVPTVTKNASNIKLFLTGSSSSYYAGAYFVEDAIDLTPYTKLKLHVESAKVNGTSEGGYVRFGTTASKKDNYTVTSAKTIVKGESGANSVTDTVFEIDITDINGLQYLFINLYGSYEKNVTYSKWWLE